MLTLQFPIQIDITKYLKQYSNAVHIAYNMMIKYPNLKTNEIDKIINKNMNNLELLDATIIRQAVLDAEAVLLSKIELFKEENKERKNNKQTTKKQMKQVVFGSKKVFKDYHNGLITKEQLQEKRLRPLIQVGEKALGNRKFKLDMENNQIIFKPKCGIKIFIKLPKLNSKCKHFKYLLILQKLVEEGIIGFTIKVHNHYIQIIFDENILTKHRKYIKPNRILSLDTNPNYVAYSICDYNEINRKKVIIKEVLNLKQLNDNEKNNNKKQYEMHEIVLFLTNQAIHYCVETIVMEKLNIKNKDHGKGKYYNKLCNNTWQKSILRDGLIKHCKINEIEFFEVNPAYSSFVGQIDNPDEIDSIGASLELGRRANILIRHKRYIQNEKLKGTYVENKELENLVYVKAMRIHDLINEDLMNRWKEKLRLVDWVGESYMDLYKKSKTGISYRSLFDPIRFGFVCSLKSEKSSVKRFYNFG